MHYHGLLHNAGQVEQEWYLGTSVQSCCLLSDSNPCRSVGTSAIQVAKKIGAKVFVTASSQEKLDFCKELGADVLINYKEQNFVDIVQQETQGPQVKVLLTKLSCGCCFWMCVGTSIIAVVFCCCILWPWPEGP